MSLNFLIFLQDVKKGHSDVKKPEVPPLKLGETNLEQPLP
jgi:hypothetical protein